MLKMLRELSLKCKTNSKTNSKTSMKTEITETPALNTVNTDTVIKRGPGRPKTKVTLKRVVLLDGKPVGKGRPAKDGKGNRTVVYVPVDQTYDVAVHGLGVKYRPGLNQFKAAIRRVDIKRFEQMVNKPQIKAVEVKSAAVVV